VSGTNRINLCVQVEYDKRERHCAARA